MQTRYLLVGSNSSHMEELLCSMLGHAAIHTPANCRDRREQLLFCKGFTWLLAGSRTGTLERYLGATFPCNWSCTEHSSAGPEDQA